MNRLLIYIFEWRDVWPVWHRNISRIVQLLDKLHQWNWPICHYYVICISISWLYFDYFIYFLYLLFNWSFDALYYRPLQCLQHWSKRKLDRAPSGLGRRDQRRSGRASSFEPMNTDSYCDLCIIILCVQRICITPLQLYAMKYVNLVLGKFVDLV